jgi:hypothetical protein
LVLQAIRDAISQCMAALAEDGMIELPVPAVLASAFKA